MEEKTVLIDIGTELEMEDLSDNLDSDVMLITNCYNEREGRATKEYIDGLFKRMVPDVYVVGVESGNMDDDLLSLVEIIDCVKKYNPKVKIIASHYPPWKINLIEAGADDFISYVDLLNSKSEGLAEKIMKYI